MKLQLQLSSRFKREAPRSVWKVEFGVLFIPRQHGAECIGETRGPPG